jgi:photosystem II stability/assembly factor-like uncharacterized protein
MAVAKDGNRIIAVGMRGLIVVSEDTGRTWQQVVSPVQSDLTGVTFGGAQHWWATGHDGVILATADGGRTWLRQFDGRLATSQFVDYYRNQIKAGRSDLQPILNQTERNFERGPVLPFLDVVFDDEKRGFVVGPFGLIAATEDAGKTWVPWVERIDNPDSLNLNGARKIGRDIYLVGERGMIYRLDRTRGRFVRLPTGYAGSLFGIVGNAQVLAAFGLRGTVVTSTDGGATWKVASIPAPAALAGADMLEDGRPVFVNTAGMVWIGTTDGSSFTPLPVGQFQPLTCVLAIAPEKLLVGGLQGLRILDLPKTIEH